jgi:MFS family permease
MAESTTTTIELQANIAKPQATHSSSKAVDNLPAYPKGNDNPSQSTIGGDDGFLAESGEPLGESLTNSDPPPVSRWRASAIIVTVSSIMFISSMLGGLLIVGLPTMAKDLKLKQSLLLWPASVNALASGCTLLLSGSISDVVGSRPMYLTGCGLLALTTLACSLSRTGIELILFRALQGIAVSFCLPSATSIVTGSFPTGSRRNIAFACLGAGQPLGFSVGLVLGGVFTSSIGWRYGYYIGTILIAFITVASFFSLPKSLKSRTPITRQRLLNEVDWVGASILSFSLGLLSYVFSVITAGSSHIKNPVNIALLCIAILLLPLFVFWVGRQESLNRVAIIPNSLWRSRVFTCICITVFVQWATFNAFEYFMTLFFQEVQLLSAIQTSIRFLPMVVSGALTNIGTGMLVHKVPANMLLLGGCFVTAISPLLMAVVGIQWSYWTCAFIATLLSPICMDVLFTVSNLLITSVFPPKTHGVAGGVFSTISQIGNSVGLAITAVIASGVTMAKSHTPAEQRQPEHLMEGYRAAFWFCFATNIVIVFVIAWGLKKIGMVGLKRE